MFKKTSLIKSLDDLNIVVNIMVQHKVSQIQIDSIIITKNFHELPETKEAINPGANQDLWTDPFGLNNGKQCNN